MKVRKHIGNVAAGSVALAATLALAVAGARPARAQAEPSAITAYLEQIRHETGAPGISAAVAVNGRIVFSMGVGQAELDNLVPADGDTVHNVGSVSKVLTAVAIMQLVEKGRISLDDRIQQYTPSFPEKGTPITLRHILTHTSGIRHYRDGEFGPYGLTEMRHFDTIEEAIAIFKDDPLLFKPGTLWSYSSHAFNLLQGVVEKATGMSFEDYMKDHVWEPAGMLSTSFDVPDRIVHKRGRGYVRDRQGHLVNSRYVDVSYKYASGGMLSTVNDLVKFGVALNDGRLLKKQTITVMYSIQVDPVMEFTAKGPSERQSFKQAIGWRIDTDAQGRQYINHTGTVRGTRSFVLNYPDHNLVVALQANVLPFDSRKYGKAIAQMFLPPIYGKQDRAERAAPRAVRTPTAW